MKPKFPYDTVETEDKEMGMFSRKDMVRLFGPLLVEQLLAVLVGMAGVVVGGAVGEAAGAGGGGRRGPSKAGTPSGRAGP